MATAAPQCTPRFGEGVIASYPDPLRTCIWNAIVEHATDVHLHCVAEGLRVLHRVDGIIHPKLLLSQAEGRKLLNQLKSAAGLNFVRSFAPVEGELTWPDGEMRWEIRVTLTPVRDRESAHLRFLNVPRDQWDLAGLGLLPADQEKIASAIGSLNGLVLVTGATGSGKTTTMYSVASQMDLRTTTTYSIEDPVEFRLPYVQQIEVDEQHGLTMHEGLRTILRMDPDLILVGEIRDSDSAMVAARAALSGRLVLATIHAQDAAGAVDALHYLGVPYHIIASSLRLIIAQNLIRRLCPDCARPHDLSDRDRELFGQFSMDVPDSVMQAVGCPDCHSYGYKGRTGVFEVAPIDDELATFIRSGPHHREVTDCLRKKGIRSMAQDGLEKVAMGVTCMDELRRVCPFGQGIEVMRRRSNPLLLDFPIGADYDSSYHEGE
ncbi:MAG: Flp pilus assembly complex ATPase component TadA [Planctomycetes bacterium]|nr:Flp pilus assembly complex ATPase component TadA [Planctomycetota bacterium]